MLIKVRTVDLENMETASDRSQNSAVPYDNHKFD